LFWLKPIVCRPHPRPKGRGNWILTTIAAQDFSINKYKKTLKKSNELPRPSGRGVYKCRLALAKIPKIKFEQTQKALKKGA